MQNTSKAYKKSIRGMKRNRGYIRTTIGVINSLAQANVNAIDSRNKFTYFSDIKKPFNGFDVEKPYATAEHDWSKVDGSMYFLPPQREGYSLYNNGIVTSDLSGKIYIRFGNVTGLDIKGLTIDFGECYPTDFTIENDGITRAYEGNSTRYFRTEDVFDGTSYFIITPTKMVNGQGRLRIYQFQCGIVNVFTNKETLSYSDKEFISSISETIPSNDVTLTVDNQDMYYSPDNPESTLAYLEIGQEVKTAFGYDVDGNGNLEWLPEKTAYLKSWSADNKKAKFTATDRFDYLTGTYYKGLYRENGISLYNLALDVLHDAGITDEREYFIDPYLKDIIVRNPIPAVKHSEALQIIANAGRCALFEDRTSKIHLQASFIPDMTASANNEMEYSHAENVLVDDEKEDYAECSKNYSSVDGNIFFMPKDENYLNTGYVSRSYYVLDTPEGSVVNRLGYRLGNDSKKVLATPMGHWEGETPTITINLEAAFTAFGLIVRFRNNAPQEFHIMTYNQDILVDDMLVENPDTEYVTYEQFTLFDKMVLVFTKGSPDSRLFVDNVVIGDVTDYVLADDVTPMEYPTSTRQYKIKSINVVRNTYNLSQEEVKELVTEEIVLSPDNLDYTVYFSNPSYGLTVAVKENPNVTVEILESSNYFAKIRFAGITTDTVVSYAVSGYEYVVQENRLIASHNVNGQEIEWNNPLISDAQHAKDMAEWLASYYLGMVEYQIKWRGDPAVDANDLFYLLLQSGEKTMIRAYQSELKFSGAWSGTLKARRVVL